MRVPVLATLAIVLRFIGVGFLILGVLILLMGVIMGLSAEVGIFVSANPSDIRMEAMLWITLGIPMATGALGALIASSFLRLLLYYEDHLYHIRGYLREMNRTMAASSPQPEKRPDIPPAPYNDPDYYDRYNREADVIYAPKKGTKRE